MADGKMDLILQQMVRFNDPIPEKFKNVPDLIPGLSLYFNAFFDLTTNRQLGMSLGPIPFNSIIQYGEYYQFNSDEMFDLIYFIREMDNAYLDYANSRSEHIKK